MHNGQYVRTHTKGFAFHHMTMTICYMMLHAAENLKDPS